MYRQVDTGTWDDPWFAELDPDAKLLFLYLLTNRRSTAAGVFEITLRAMAFETSLDVKRVNAALGELSTRVEWWPEYQTVWIKNFLRHQAVSPKFYISAWSEMREMPDEIRESVGSQYPILTRDEKPPDSKDGIEALLIPYPKGIDRVSEPSRKTSLVKPSTRLEETSRLDNGADAPKSRPSSKPVLSPEQLDRFSRWYQHYPRKVNRAAAEKAWTTIDPDDALVDVMIATTKAWAASEAWTKDGGTFVPHPSTWLNGKRWEDDAPPSPAEPLTFQKAGKADPWAEYARRKGYDTDDSPSDVIDTTARRTS